MNEELQKFLKDLHSSLRQPLRDLEQDLSEEEIAEVREQWTGIMRAAGLPVNKMSKTLAIATLLPFLMQGSSYEDIEDYQDALATQLLVLFRDLMK